MKYFIKKHIFKYSGYLDYKLKRLSPGLYVFNYHRVGEIDHNDFDDNVFSCDAAMFRRQVGFIKENFELINIPTLVNLLNSNAVLERPLGLITFDDGYIDNYEVAFPILKEWSASAVFFLPTSYINSNIIPWWDEIAWMVKNTNKKQVSFLDGSPDISIDRGNISQTIRDVLRHVKSNTNTTIFEKINSLRNSLDCILPEQKAQSLFMSWDQVLEMKNSGMDIGSHTHSHCLLSHLTCEEQLDELVHSKKILESQLSDAVASIAYPVGKSHTYTNDTIKMCQQAGYDVAFNFIHGFNLSVSNKPYDLNRLAMDGNQDEDDIKLVLASL